MAETSETAQPPVTEQDGTSDRRNASRTPQPGPQPIVSQAPPTPTQARISPSRTSQRSRVQQTGQPTAESSEKTQPLVIERAQTSDVRYVSPVPQPRVSAAPQTPTNPQARIPHSRTRQRTRGQQSGRPMAASPETTQPSLMCDKVATLEVRNASPTLQPKVSQETQNPTNPQVRISRTTRNSRMRGQVSLHDPEHQRLFRRILPNPPVTLDAPQLGSLGQNLSPVATNPAAQTYSPLYHTPAPRVQAQQQLQPTIGQQNSSIPPTSLQLRAPPIRSSVSVEPASQIFPHLGHTSAPQAQGPQQIPPAVTRGQSDSIPPPSLQQSAPQLNSSIPMVPAAQMHFRLHHTPKPQVQVQQHLPSPTAGRTYSTPSTSLQQSASQIQSSVLMKPAAQMHPQHSQTPASQLQAQQQFPPFMTSGQGYTLPSTSLRQSAPQINSSVSMEPAAQMHSRLQHTPPPQVQVQQHLPSATAGQSYSIPSTSLQHSQIQSSALTKPAAQMHPQHSQTPASQLQVQQPLPPVTGRRPRRRLYSIPLAPSQRQSAPRINSLVSMVPAAQMHSCLHHTPTPQVQVQQHLPSPTAGQTYSILSTSLQQNASQIQSSVLMKPAAQMHPQHSQTPASQLQAQQQFPPFMTSGQGYSFPSTSLRQSAPQISSSVSMEPAAQMHSRLHHTPTPQVVQQHLPSATAGQSYSIPSTSLQHSQIQSSALTKPAAQMHPQHSQTPAVQLQAQQQFPPLMTSGQGYSPPPTRPHQSASPINSSASMELAAQMHAHLHYTPAPQLQQQHPPVPGGQSYSFPPTSLHQSVREIHSAVSIELAGEMDTHPADHTPALQVYVQQQLPRMPGGQCSSIPKTRLLEGFLQIYSLVCIEPTAKMFPYLHHTSAPQLQVQQQLPRMTGGQSSSIPPTRLQQNIPQNQSSVSIEPAAPQTYANLYQSPAPQVQAQPQLPPMIGGQSYSIPDRSSVGGILRDVPFSDMLAQLVAPVGPLGRISSQIHCVPDHYVYATKLLESEMEKEKASFEADLKQILARQAREEEELRRKYEAIERERASKLIADFSAPGSASEQPNAAPGLTQCHNCAEAIRGSGQAGSSSRRRAPRRAQRPGRRNPYTSPQRNVVGQNVGYGPYIELSSTDVNVSSGPVVPPLAPPFPTSFPSTGIVSSHEPSLPASASFSKGSGPSTIDSVVVSAMRSPLNALLENLSSHHNNLESVSDPNTSTAPADVAPIVTGAVVSVGPCSLNTNVVSPPDSPPRGNWLAWIN